eukprot:234968_1
MADLPQSTDSSDDEYGPTMIDFDILSHNYDPLGIIYNAICSSLMIITYNIPKGIASNICSYLPYSETTMKGVMKYSTCTFSPGPDAYELCVVINTPNTTLLANNSYMLSGVTFPFKGVYQTAKDYYAGIQLFGKHNYQQPGEGEIIYKSDVMNSFDAKHKDERMCKLSLDIELKCNQSYLFFIKQTEHKQGCRNGICISLVDRNNIQNKSILSKLNFCTTVFWYPSTKYQMTDQYSNFFEMWFHCKGC